VLLGLLAHEETDEALALRHGNRGTRQRDRRHHRSADGLGAATGRRFGNELPGREKSRRPQQGPASVDVVLSRLPARKRDLAEHERMLAQLGDEGVAGGGHARRDGSA
jgi:hypothetical protein